MVRSFVRSFVGGVSFVEEAFVRESELEPRSSSSVRGGSRRFVVLGGSFVVVWSAGVGVGAFGGGSVCAEETRAARIRGADGTQGSPLSLFLFHLGFCVCVCVS